MWNKLAQKSVKWFAYREDMPAQRTVARLQEFLFDRAYPVSGAPRQHNLPHELIVSLTSYPRRYPTLDFTLRSLLDQVVKPDRIILWVTDADISCLPVAVRNLPGIEIRTCSDLRSYKKLVPALEMFPNAFIVTADDDVFYQRSWLKELLDEWSEDAPTIRCHRAHRLRSLPNGQLAPYRTWEKDVQDEQSRSPSKDLLPTGLAGVLYHPGSLHRDVTNASMFLSLCPTADDLWFYWQARRVNSLYVKVGSRFPQAHWAGSQSERLYDVNLTANDEQIQLLFQKYGLAEVYETELPKLEDC